MGRRRQDAYGKKARREGFPARSVYKLEEIDRRTRLFRQGQRVLDLGAYPGSWSLYAAGKVGGRGKVLGIDITEHRGALPGNVEMRTADVREIDPAELGQFDVVLSDMAPSTTGARPTDQQRSYELFSSALEIASAVLVPGGSFVGKLFQSAEFEPARARMRELFEQVRIIRPQATRTESIELFLIGLRRRPS